MQTSERNRLITVDQLYRTLARAHTPLAAALMAASVTGEWPLAYGYSGAVTHEPR